VFSNCILTKIKEKAEQTIGEYQGGFRPGKSTTDQIFIIRLLYQKTWEFDREIHTLFVDFKKAYDSIHRESLINILKEFDFPRKLVNIVSISIMETVVRVKVGNMKSDPVTVKSGLRQGDSILPIIFNLVLEKVIREMKIEPHEGIKLRDSNIPLLAYADDVVLMDESQDGVKWLCDRLNDAAQKVGLQINEQKIKN
jgi:sorting nexin-29